MARQRLEKRLARDEQWGLRLKRAESQVRTLVAVGDERVAQAPLWYRGSLGLASQDSSA